MSNIVKKAIGVLKSPKKRTIILAQRGFFKNMSDEDFLKSSLRMSLDIHWIWIILKHIARSSMVEIV